MEVFAVADRGMAMGHIGGKLAFVPFAAPGDRVEVEVVREKRRHIETRILRVLNPSPMRRSPLCPHFGVCGGCQWQHLAYSDQLEAKARSFEGFLATRLSLGNRQFFRPPVPAPREWGYRARVGLKVRQVQDRVLVGFFARGTHCLVDVETCPVAHPAIQRFLPALRSFLGGFRPAHGALPQIDLQADGLDRLWAVFHVLRPLAPSEAAEIRAFLARTGVAAAFQQAGRKHTLSPLWGGEEGLPFFLNAGARRLEIRVTPGGFFQANLAVNQALVEEVAALAPYYRGQPVLDLYCGAGNFTLPMSLEASRVAGVEGYPPAAREAEANAHRNGLSAVSVLTLSARHGLDALAAEGFRPAFALLDPPREGAAEALPGLLRLGPERILYVSCAPPTLARDLRALVAGGYRVEWTRVADMFPQTEHVESLTLLCRPF